MILDVYFKDIKPAYVFIAAAKVGGILANQTQPVEFLLENLAIQNTLIPLSHKHGVRKLLFLGSTCIYPKHADQPIKESALLSGPLEPTNEAYAIAKIAGIKLCQAYRKQYGFDAICAQPTNLYGPNDNFSLTSSHVIPGIIRRIHQAKQEKASTVTCWGSGSPLREFLFVDDLADACVFLMNNYSDVNIVNVGTGEEVSIADLTRLICDELGWNGSIAWDTSKPDGTPRKVCDVTLLKSLGWEPKVGLEEGLKRTVEWFVANEADVRGKVG
jgi:GDP-L-fucose synthase